MRSYLDYLEEKRRAKRRKDRLINWGTAIGFLALIVGIAYLIGKGKGDW